MDGLAQIVMKRISEKVHVYPFQHNLELNLVKVALSNR